MQNILIQEKNALTAVIAPQTINTAAGTVTSGVVDALQFEQLAARVNIGTVAAADVVITLRQATLANMSDAKTLKTYTVTAAAVPSGKQVIMGVRGQDFDRNGGFRYGDLTIVHDDATGGPISAEIEGTDGPYQSSQSHLATTIVVAYP
jgi:hypothetical protein